MNLPSRSWLVFALAASAFVAFFFWSVLQETLLPLWHSGNALAFWANVIGLPLLVAGTLLLPAAIGMLAINLFSDKFKVWGLTSRRRFLIFLAVVLAMAALGSYLVNGLV